MIPSALLFSRYRLFREPTRFELAPLTVVIGKNGGGKSVLTRLPLLISGGLDFRADAPLDLTAGSINHATRFEDLIYQRSAQPFSLGAEITEQGRTYKFITTLRHIVERHALAVERFEVSATEGADFRLEVAEPEDIGNPMGNFLGRFGTDQTDHLVQIKMVGLFPMEILGNVEATTRLQELRNLFEKAFASPCYLGPFRAHEESLPRIPRQGVRNLGPRGERALDLLGDDLVRGDGALVREVENWFEAEMGGYRVQLDRTGDLPRLLVHDPIRNVDVDMFDTGAGFAQVLPVVVQAFALRMHRIESAVFIVEQPELHLHPAAHGSIADLIGDTMVLCGDRARFICETHSEQIITRLRRRIAEERFTPEMVRIGSVGHQGTVDETPEPLRPITLDTFGNPDGWPIGVFSEAYDDLVHLREAVQRRLADTSVPEA